MHTFDATGEFVVFYDAFGFSTLNLATGKLKTDKAISGRWFSANGGTALVHNERANARVSRGLPDLAKTRLGDGSDLKYSKVAVLADGKRAAKGAQDSLEVISIASGAKTTVPLVAGKKLGPFTLGPRLDPHVQWEVRPFIGVDDSVAVFTSEGTLFGGQLTKTGLAKPWSVKCGLPQGRVTAIPHASGTFVSAWHPAPGRSFCAVINGEATAREVDSISPATWSGEALVYQPSPGEVVREPLSGGTAERFQLPKTAYGPGELMAHGSSILFIPFDRARVIDVVSGKVFDRKLGSNLIEVRTAFLEYERRFNELGRVSNLLVDLNCFNKPRFGREHTPGFSWDGGDLGFLRLTISAWLVHSLSTENQGRWSLGSYSNPNTIRPIDAREMVRDFEAIDRGAIDLLTGVGFLHYPLQEAYGGTFQRDKKVKVKKAMGKDAEHLLLWAIIEQLKSKTRIELAKNAPAWAKQKLTPEIFIKHLEPTLERQDWSDAQFAVTWLVLDYFGPDAVKVFIDLLIERPSGMARANSHIMGDAPRRMMMQFPETKKPMQTAIAAAKKTAKGDLVGYLENIGSYFP